MITMTIIAIKRLGIITIGTADHQSEVVEDTLEAWEMDILLLDQREKQLKPGAEAGAEEDKAKDP
jgi:hypothetical protein